MERHGALAIGNFPKEIVRLRCDKCGREGRYRRATLERRYGSDAGLPDVLRELADCEKFGLAGDPCGAVYPDLS